LGVGKGVGGFGVGLGVGKGVGGFGVGLGVGKGVGGLGVGSGVGLGVGGFGVGSGVGLGVGGFGVGGGASWPQTRSSEIMAPLRVLPSNSNVSTLPRTSALICTRTQPFGAVVHGVLA
jgi:hypothetical protein